MHTPAEPALHCMLEAHLQFEDWHENPGGHARPHAPQLPGLLVVSTQPAGVWQHVWPEVHAAPPLQEHTSVVWWTQTSPG
jgi:hypothetical protein